MLKLLRKWLGVPSREDIEHLLNQRLTHAHVDIDDLRRSYLAERERVLEKLTTQSDTNRKLNALVLRQKLRIDALERQTNLASQIEVHVGEIDPDEVIKRINAICNTARGALGLPEVVAAPALPADHPEVVAQRERNEKWSVKPGSVPVAGKFIDNGQYLNGVSGAEHKAFELNPGTEGRRAPDLNPHYSCAEFHRISLVQREFYRPTLGQLVHRVNATAREFDVKPEYIKSPARTMVRAWPIGLLMGTFTALVAENKAKV